MATRIQRWDIGLLGSTGEGKSVEEQRISCEVVYNGGTVLVFGNLKTILTGIMKYALERGYTDFSISYFFGDLSIGRNAFKKRVVDPEKEVLKEDEIPIVKEYLLKRGTIRDTQGS